LAMMVDIINVAFHGALTLLTIGLALSADRRMISVDLPKSIVYGFVAFALFAATVVAVQRLLQRSRLSGSEILADLEKHADQEEQL